MAVRMLPNVKQRTIQPLVETCVAPGTTVSADEYDIYDRLEEWGFEHRSVCHSWGESARDDDGACEVHVARRRGSGRCCGAGCARTAASRRRACRLYLGFFQFVHTARQRGKALMHSLVDTLLKTTPRNPH